MELIHLQGEIGGRILLVYGGTATEKFLALAGLIVFIAFVKHFLANDWDCHAPNDTVSDFKSWRLNERHYGALQGLNKEQVAKQYGSEQRRRFYLQIHHCFHACDSFFRFLYLDHRLGVVIKALLFWFGGLPNPPDPH
eukprot:scaffold124519_cov15-Tisochrysis_lutea.AAC.1